MTTSISDSPNQSRGSIRGDLLIVVAILAAMALCGCEPLPKPDDISGPVPDGSPLAFTRCELLTNHIDKADGPGASARAAGRAQACWLRLIERRLRLLETSNCCPPPPAPPSKAPDATPQPRQTQKTPLTTSLVGPNGGRN